MKRTGKNGFTLIEVLACQPKPWRRQAKAAFTLIEVLVVIAIIALLAALILGLANNAQKSAARNKAEAEITQLQSFVTDYQMEYGQVPADRNALIVSLIRENHSLTNMVDPWGMEYHYVKSSKVTFYLWSDGGDTNQPPSARDRWIGNPEP